MNYWDVHGWWFLFFMLVFPRITMLVSGICFMTWLHPVLFWFGWVLTPRFVGAILATWFYFHTNPVVCIFAWIAALGVSVGQKKIIKIKRN